MVHIHASEKIVDLRAESIDLAIRYGPAGAEPRDQVLFDDVYFAVAAKELCPADRPPRIDDFHNRALLAYKWKNQALEAPGWSAWLEGAGHERGRDFRISWFSEETLALHAAERGLGPLLCSNVLVEDELRTGRMRRIEGPQLAGFSYRLVEVAASGRRRSLSLFIDWLNTEARLFREAAVAPLPEPAG
ncbi:LysR substrate binding domain protein [compost metagenome]